MLRSTYLTLIYLSFFVLGRGAPFVLVLGYCWVDTFSPQAIATEFLTALPVSMIMAVAAIGSYAVLDRAKGRLTAMSGMLLLFAAWVTLSTFLWAEVPADAFEKWNYAFKTLCFAAFLPFVIRSRIQIEALIQIYLFSIMVHFLPVGVKTLISGGGYGRALGVVGGNALLSEGATLAGVALMLVPLILYLGKNNLLLPRLQVVRLGYAGLAVLAIAAAVGTYERTALVGLAIVGIGTWLRSRRKLLFGLASAAVVAAVALTTSSAWTARISTIQQFNTESSALGRILVWEWTLRYVSEHPLGGGFNSYKVDHIILPPETRDGPPVVRNGIAFHSVYFEVLGEQGYVGIGIFFSIILLALAQLQKVARLSKGVDHLSWARDLAFALQVSLLTLLACGAFIGIAFQPMLYYLFALAACLRAHVREVERLGYLPAPKRTRPAKRPAFMPA